MPYQKESVIRIEKGNEKECIDKIIAFLGFGQWIDVIFDGPEKPKKQESYSDDEYQKSLDVYKKALRKCREDLEVKIKKACRDSQKENLSNHKLIDMLDNFRVVTEVEYKKLCYLEFNQSISDCVQKTPIFLVNKKNFKGLTQYVSENYKGLPQEKRLSYYFFVEDKPSVFTIYPLDILLKVEEKLTELKENKFSAFLNTLKQLNPKQMLILTFDESQYQIILEKKASEDNPNSFFKERSFCLVGKAAVSRVKEYIKESNELLKEINKHCPKAKEAAQLKKVEYDSSVSDSETMSPKI